MKFFILTLFLHSFLIVAAQRNCATANYWQSQLKGDPALLMRYQQMERTAKLRSLLSLKNQESGVADVPIITIPVVVHVLYNKPEQNISDAQIQSQLAVLNKDFRKGNADTAKIPAAFAAFATDSRIQFELAKVDPGGRTTSGITRKATGQVSWQQDDKMKFSASGGHDAWDSRYYLNIWVCNLTKSLLGYSTFPGAPAEKDGIVIRTDVFGVTGNHSAYNKGRTTTHEVGHWLNLKHLWGDLDCGDDDVEDTPRQKTYSSGCPSFPQITPDGCNPNPAGDMFMNFMDFSDDACLHMFTYGQMQRMHDLFGSSGARASLLQSTALSAPWKDSDTAETTPVNERGFVVFPNPASTMISFQFNNKKLQTTGGFYIYTATGRLVLQGRNTGGAISIQALPAGMYFIKLEQDQQVLVTKLIKQY